MRTVRVFLLIAVFAALSALYVSAQSQERERDEHRSAGKATTLTGCLAKGDEAGEFHLTADSGKVYDLRSDEVSLAEHVGHKITVTGRAMKESHEAGEKHESGEKHEAQERHEGRDHEGKEAGGLRVSKVQMVSDTCGTNR